MRIHNQNPKIELEFRLASGVSFTLKKAVLSYQSQRALASPTAHATIVMQGHKFPKVGHKDVDGKDITKVLQSNDLCKVTMLDGKQNRQTDIIGLVKIKQQIAREEQGRPVPATAIQIQGLGAELEQYQIFWHPHIAGRNNLGGVGYLARSSGKLPSGRPNEVIQSLYDVFLNDDYVFTLPDGRKIHQAIQPQFSTFGDANAKTALKALGLEIALWQTLKRYSDAPWGELFVDIQHEYSSQRHLGVTAPLAAGSGDKVGLYFRPTPFDSQDWDRLAAEDGWGFTYADGDRMGAGEQLSQDENKVYNFFWVPMASVYSGFDQLSLAYNQSGGLLPVYDEESIRRHGLRRLEQSTEYVEYKGASDQQTGVMTPEQLQRSLTKATNLHELLIKRTFQLWKWNGYSDKFFEGAIQTRGRIGPDNEHGARIGSVLTRKRDDMQFYVTGIMQQWQMPGPHITTWQVQRGHLPAEYRKWWKSKLDGFLQRYGDRLHFMKNYDETIQHSTGGRFT